jgi:hypothetical protein
MGETDEISTDIRGPELKHHPFGTDDMLLLWVMS